MNFLKKIFRHLSHAEASNDEDFWVWFLSRAEGFYQIVRSNKRVDEGFLELVMPRLQMVNPQFYCLTGMCDKDTAELIITAEGDIKSFVFAEELVARAPAITGWKFTALKPPTAMDSFSLNMEAYTFDNNNIHFFYNDDAAYPDEINISLLYEGYSDSDKKTITQGCLLYLENSLGELNMATQIDDLSVAPELPAGKDAIPIAKLEGFLAWREKELIEKYEGTRHDTKNDNYSIMEARDKEGFPVIALINRDLLQWEVKASHPWMMIIEISYDGSSRSGMPDSHLSAAMDQLETSLEEQLPDSEGYLNLGRVTYSGKRTIYFACKEFRRSSLVAAAALRQQELLQVSYDIYKDKYWQSMNRFKAED